MWMLSVPADQFPELLQSKCAFRIFWFLGLRSV